MNSIIEELYYGNINPNCSEENDNEAFLEAVQKGKQCKDKLCPLLKEEEKHLLLAAMKAYDSAIAELSLNRFTVGFKLGLLFGVEAASNGWDYLHYH